MRKSLAWKLAVVAALAGLFAAGWVFFYEPMRTAREWSDAVRADIESLKHKRPPDVTPAQWECTVMWTLNLHGNCASWHTPMEPIVDLAWRDGFAAELHRRLQGPVTLADIDWIWDEYAKHTKGGQRYSDDWRPTRDRNIFPR